MKYDIEYEDCDYLNYELCKGFYGKFVTEYIYNRIEEDFGRNGLDLFLDKVPQTDKDLIREYVVDYYGQPMGVVPRPRT